ncbi:hypothetical protein [Sphingobacterium multivorum]|uniref:hypothetical protein n=1 Tax=Sphingobacterium multivorum TaxID=28454 RepID=UPI002FD9ADCE
MDLKEFLKNNPIINKAELARQMWPGTNTPNIKLSNKMAGSESGTGKQRITEADEKAAKDALLELSRKIAEYAKG